MSATSEVKRCGAYSCRLAWVYRVVLAHTRAVVMLSAYRGGGGDRQKFARWQKTAGTSVTGWMMISSGSIMVFQRFARFKHWTFKNRNWHFAFGRASLVIPAYRRIKLTTTLWDQETAATRDLLCCNCVKASNFASSKTIPLQLDVQSLWFPTSCASGGSNNFRLCIVGDQASRCKVELSKL